jgi:lipoprotein-anchoring transpeptidase ErfK/SrfK
MNTLKNAALLLVMGGVLYFVYITLNKPPGPAGGAHVNPQHESVTPDDLEIVTGIPTAPGIPDAVPAPYESPAASGRNSPWQPEGSPPGIAENAPPVNEPPSAYSIPQDPAPSSANPRAVAAAQRRAQRRGGWNQNGPIENGPPVAPDVVDYGSTSIPNAATIEPAEAGSQYAVVNPSANATPVVDPNVAPVTNVEPIPATPTAITPSPTLTGYILKQKFSEANHSIDQGRYREALQVLTELYQRPDISAADRAVLLRWLDPLAAKVIYSPEHLLAEGYKVGRNEDLPSLAARMQVPTELLQKINSVRNPDVLIPGTLLKVIPGPFSADVDMSTNEMTLYVKNLYAGRFPFTIGDEPPRPGQYMVQEKSLDRPYYGRDKRTIPARDPSNPYGNRWIDLGSGVCLHGSPTSAGVAGNENHGCVSFSPRDAEDIFAILSHGSAVTIR